MAEIVRAGIESIDPGQMEAAKSLGMTYGLAMRRIVLPQAAKVIIPPLGNEFNNMMKTTSLMVVISAPELFLCLHPGQRARFQALRVVYRGFAFITWFLTTIWSFIQARIEASLGERKGVEKRAWHAQAIVDRQRTLMRHSFLRQPLLQLINRSSSRPKRSISTSAHCTC